jgi:hypothetical protein
VQKSLTVVAVAAFLAIAYFVLRNEFAPDPVGTPVGSDQPLAPVDREPAAPARRAERAQPGEPAVSGPAAEPALPLPALAESDDFVRERLADFDLPAEWVAQDDLVRRLAVFSDNATRGEMARRRLRFLAPEGAFRVIERDGRTRADPRNAQRFDAYLDLLEEIEPERAATLIRQIEPLLDEALAGLGSPRSGRATLVEAVERVLDAPAPMPGAELVRPKVLYQYADPALESLPPLEKQLMRIGSQNLARLKDWLARFRLALDGGASR